jgi:hypothetical protein
MPSSVSGTAAASCTGDGGAGGDAAATVSVPGIGWSVMQPATQKALASRTAPDAIRHRLFTRITLPPRLAATPTELPRWLHSDYRRQFPRIPWHFGNSRRNSRGFLPENLNYFQAYGEGNDHKDHRENKQGKRHQHLHRKLVGLFLGAQHPSAAHFITEHPKRLADIAT